MTGTPAGSPSPPSAPANSFTLAQVAVAANATSITSGNITDQRTAPWFYQRGNIAWSLPAEGTAPSPPARIARRLALILQGAPVVLDAQEGFALARIGDRPVRCAALADDGSVAICEESGALSLARLATHLSIVTT